MSTTPHDAPPVAADPAPDLFTEFEDEDEIAPADADSSAAVPPAALIPTDPDAADAPDPESGANVGDPDSPDSPEHETRALAAPPDPALDLSQDGPYARYIALSYIKGAGFVDLPARSLSVQETWQLVRDCDKLDQIVAPLGPYRRTKYTPILPARTPRRS